MSTYPDRTPPINATGKYVLRQPFFADPLKNYRCEAIRGFNEIEITGGRVYEEYYRPMGLPDKEYRGDAASDINIVTLFEQGTDKTIEVPSSYIISYPNMGGVPYVRGLVVIDLGPIADDYVADMIVNEVTMRATNMLGAPTKGYLVTAPIEHPINKDEARALENGRKNSITGQINSAAVAIEKHLIADKNGQAARALSTVIALTKK